MEFYKREYFINRIVAGYVKYKDLRIYHPDEELAYEASEVYKDAYEKAVDNGVYNDNDVKNLLIKAGKWSEEKELQLNKIVPDHIEYWKVELYNTYLKSGQREKIRKYLMAAKQEQLRLHQIRSQYNHITCAGYANFAKTQFLIINAAKRVRGGEIDWSLYNIHELFSFYTENTLSFDTIRELSRTLPWVNMWSALKKNGRIFERTYLTEEQRLLLYWSTIYDNIHESPECPSDEVLEDDDMLDGWLIIQRRKRDSEKIKRTTEGILSNSKIGNADEVFIAASNSIDAQKIDALNDIQASMVKTQRFKQIDRSGTVNELELTDVNKRLMMEATQKFSQTMKGR